MGRSVARDRQFRDAGRGGLVGGGRDREPAAGGGGLLGLLGLPALRDHGRAPRAGTLLPPARPSPGLVPRPTEVGRLRCAGPGTTPTPPSSRRSPRSGRPARRAATG